MYARKRCATHNTGTARALGEQGKKLLNDVFYRREVNQARSSRTGLSPTMSDYAT